MAVKQLTELETATIAENGDLLLIRKTNAGVDRKINWQSVVQSLSKYPVDTATNFNQEDYVVVGQGDILKKILKNDFDSSLEKEGSTQFTATQNTNDFTLTSITGSKITQYRNGQIISFLATNATNGQVRIKIGTLGFVNLYRFNVDETVVLTAGEYVQAIYNNGVFKRVNEVDTNQVWSSDYNASVVVDSQNQWTHIYLTSAIGAKKTTYYKGMTINFDVPTTAKIDTKNGQDTPLQATRGAVSIFIDDLLTSKSLGDSENDMIANPLYAGEIIWARYNGTKFVKRKILAQEPNLEELSQQLDIEPEEVEALIEQVEEANVTVGPSGQYKDIMSAIKGLVQSYGKDGGGRKCTITLQSNDAIFGSYQYGYNNAQISIKDVDYGWITITNAENYTFKTDNHSFISAENAVCPNIKLNITHITRPSQEKIFIQLKNSTCSVIDSALDLRSNFFIHNSKVTCTNSSIIWNYNNNSLTNLDYASYLIHADTYTDTNFCSFTDCILKLNRTATNSNNGGLMNRYMTLNMLNCTVEVLSSIALSGWLINISGTTNIENSTIDVKQIQSEPLSLSGKAVLTNCTVKGYNVGADFMTCAVTIKGGAYSNIVGVDNMNAPLRFRNNSIATLQKYNNVLPTGEYINLYNNSTITTEN